ncbi:TAP-like protein-domain-containing protein [Mycena rosella]|uniref:TAP-like protein-domain-containing protein n=1 Tax=Mycena rosella TaxID=1033263 RepID=A0AAD7GTV6_MYCRO|nr:TAP-like protein-domain-containing protein [Mycena rosella]
MGSGDYRGELAGERDNGSLRLMNTDHTAREMLRIVQAHYLDKSQYWGFSYGSILGATFASMFPEHVGRLVIDGVADAENYFATDWSSSLSDTEKAWSTFLDGCVAAGPAGCPFFSPTAAEISENVDKLYASLRSHPIPVRTPTSFGLVEYSMLRHAIFQSLYFPYATFPLLAQAIADLAAGNATALFKMSEKPPFECDYDESQNRFEPVGEGGDAVLCNDGQRIPWAYEDFVAHYAIMSETSPSSADPATPLNSAHKMSQGFPGSVVLTQDSAGHCSISGPSLCTQKYIQQYFLEGTLPASGTVCPVVGSPFPTDGWAVVDAQAVLGLSAGNRAILKAVRELAARFEIDIRFPTGL